MGFEPPQRLVRTLGEQYGEPAAAEWLSLLPALAGEAVAARGLEVERVVAPGGRGGLVVLVRRADGSPATLKIVPSFAAPSLERAALAHWKGWGAVELLDPASTADTALLLERLQPEISLRSLPEAKALLEAAGTVRRLWVDPPEGHAFETVAERTARESAALRESADEGLGPLVSAALEARDELCASAASVADTRLLHGAFGQGKVLAGERAPWLAVGPEPLVGEPAYDLARLARDRVEDLVAASSGPSSARRRVSRLADSLDMDRGRLRGWTLFRAVESGVRALRAGRRQSAELLLEFAGWL
ncbi:aminoglycoside phosphotransferase family protein [Streptomyces sp. GMY02]|uniref:aminoglycoside phosphotransferase family protein n=1 Tax=Streptomyces sp. GMY02 TaxID=1333528 RepID=UPI001C2C418C|nr:aminoglycoside phosphotransferase family protein [Streptomyces sp. GMY02]QXE34381.1 aminoglycoside phosphotransferase family protein [Streptomyces sp. GMY02]